MKKIYLVLSLFAALHLQAQITYTTSTIVTGLSNPVAFDFSPDGRIFVTQKGGAFGPASDAEIKVFSSTGTLLGTFYDLTDSVNSDFERGLLGIAIDPDYATTNHIYAYYNHNYNNDERIRVVRFTDSSNVGINPTIIFDVDVANNIAGNHVGGNIHFRPSEPGQLYISIGDLAYQSSSTTLNYAQQLSSPFGKMLRINKDGTIPTNNPFYDDGNPSTGNCDWIWSYGHRNSFDFCFNPVTDSMYCSENGAVTWDEVDQVVRGGNYGWNTCEGFNLTGSTTTLCNLAGAIDPIEVWGNPLPSVTGILFYSGSVMSEFDNHLLVSDNDNGRIYDLTLGNAPVYDTLISRVQWIDLTSTGGLTTIRQGSDGCVWAMKGGYTSNGEIYQVCHTNITGVNELQAGIHVEPGIPNPFHTSSVVNYTLDRNQQVRVILFDVTGREIALISDAQQTTGAHQLEINAEHLNLSAGTYFLSFQTGNSKQSLRLVVTD